MTKLLFLLLLAFFVSTPSLRAQGCGCKDLLKLADRTWFSQDIADSESEMDSLSQTAVTRQEDSDSWNYGLKAVFKNVPGEVNIGRGTTGTSDVKSTLDHLYQLKKDQKIRISIQYPLELLTAYRDCTKACALHTLLSCSIVRLDERRDALNVTYNPADQTRADITVDENTPLPAGVENPDASWPYKHVLLRKRKTNLLLGTNTFHLIRVNNFKDGYSLNISTDKGRCSPNVPALQADEPPTSCVWSLPFEAGVPASTGTGNVTFQDFCDLPANHRYVLTADGPFFTMPNGYPASVHAEFWATGTENSRGSLDNPSDLRNLNVFHATVAGTVPPDGRVQVFFNVRTCSYSPYKDDTPRFPVTCIGYEDGIQRKLTLTIQSQ